MPKVVVVTGGTSGIGLATAKYLASKKYIVYSLARHCLNVEGINFLSCDVTDEKSIEESYKIIVEREGKIDALVNNAGMGISGAFEYGTTQDIEAIVKVNLLGAINVDKYVIPYLRKSKGRIIHIGSIAGELAIPFQTMYSITKGGIHRLSEALAMELQPFSIKVSCVMPGDTKTGFTASRVKNTNQELYQERINRSVQKMEKDEQNGVEPIKVAQVIYKCLTKKNPPLKVAVGFSYKLIMLLNRLLPSKLVAKILYGMYAK